MQLQQNGRRMLAAGLALVTVVISPLGAAATGRDDPRHERDQVRRRQADVAGQLDVLKADQAEVESALDALEANVAGQRAALQDAQRAADAASAAAAAALAEEQAAERELSALQASLRAVAVEAYMHPPTESQLDVLSTDDINVAVQRRALLDLRAGRTADAIDRMRAAEEDLSVTRAATDDAAAAASEHRAAVEVELQQLEAAEAEHERIAGDVGQRVEAALAEAANLATLDADLARRIEEDNRRLAARVPSGGGGARISVSGNVTIVSVRGIQVNADIADELESLLAAAEADGYHLSGGGYRDPADQIRLREAHCPDVYNSPPSACSPPTARPGQSMHEVGLAVDFTCNGSLITSRSNGCFQWLASNARSYGFYNLPSEPWHWSVNGQ